MAARGTERAARQPGGRALRAGVHRPAPGVGVPTLDLRPLSPSFFRQPTLDVARGLLGCLLLRRSGAHLIGGWIVEVEAYVGEEDPACHAAAGPTARNAAMYGPPGRAYVYFTYGMHHCVNVVTGGAGRPEAVLVRAIEPAVGQAFMRRRRGPAIRDMDLARGPGRLCRALGIDLRLNGAALDDRAGSGLFLSRGRGGPRILGVSARIGIRRGVERPWRYYDAESPWVSRVRPAGPRPGRQPDARREVTG